MEKKEKLWQSSRVTDTFSWVPWKPRLGSLCSSPPGQQPASPLHACESSEQVLQRYLHTVFPGAFRWAMGFLFCRAGKPRAGRVLDHSIHPLPCSTSHVLQQPCNTRPPYPQFFSPLLSREGFLLDRPPGSSSAGNECPVSFLCSRKRSWGAAGSNTGKLLKNQTPPTFECL